MVLKGLDDACEWAMQTANNPYIDRPGSAVAALPCVLDAALRC